MVNSDSDPQYNQDEEGASKGEQLIAAARGNNIQLLKEIIDSFSDANELANLLNNTKTPMGNHIYHEAALRGNYEIIDILLDQEGFECDPINRMEGDTPLHSAIRYINDLPIHEAQVESFSREFILMMIESGSNPRIKNKANLTPIQLLDPKNKVLRSIIQDAIDIEQNKGDYIMEDKSKDDNENYGSGSASESDKEP